MERVLMLLAAAVAAASAQSLPYSQSLNANYKVNWGVNNDTIELELSVITTGWVSFALIAEDAILMDVWWGGYDEEYGIAYFQDANPSARYPDTINNLPLLEVAQSPFGGTTKIRFRRAFFTGDYKQDVHILPNTNM